ncbi:response regulator transcription factor [Pontibacillus salicampi]|uniref:Response regulator transcription factor n=1 Tax=Pontibacillus salicampi TaxID=1449801 RepID=A0ABV6LK49_9BACI
MYTIWIVEDDIKIAELLKAHISKYGYQVGVVRDWNNLMEEFVEQQPHLVLMDVNLPQFDGFYWCRKIRSISNCPIIFLSARDGDMDQVMALEYGGDDYITKPFAYEVAMAKIKSQLRRVYGEYSQLNSNERTIVVEQLKLLPERLLLQMNNQEVSLSKKEADLLQLLMTHYPKVVSRTTLLEALWDDELFVDENTLSVNITRTRKKLEELNISHAIETVRGEGYKLKATWNKGDAI